MRIPIKVCFFAGGLRAMVSFLLTSKEPHIFGFVNAIVDSGSPATILGDIDLKRMRISQIQLRKLVGKKEPLLLGGGKVKTRVLENAHLKLGDYSIDVPIEVPVEETKGFSQTTILGVDFLLKTKFKFIFNPDKREAYFED